jgi:VWFA-related protein
MRVLIAALLLAPALFAQKVQEQITVNVVEVPVSVERHGAPVTGLTREDFELFVNGQPQSIDYFDVVEERAAADAEPAAKTPVALNRRRLNVLLFDIAASVPVALQLARKSALSYVAQAQPGDTFAVATIGGRGVQFVVPFTSDRIAVQRAIATLTPTGARDPFGVAMLETERNAWRGAVVGGTEAGLGNFEDIWGEQMAPGGFTGSVAASSADEARVIALAWQQAELDSRTRGFAEHLSALADRLAPLSGLKHVVLLSARKTLDDELPFVQAANRLHRHFQAAGVVLDAVDINLPKAPWPGAKPQLLPTPLLYSLALGTGGAVTSRLSHLRQRNRVTYVLAFQPRGAQKKTNDIRVKVKGQPPLTDVRYRRTYSIDAPGAEDHGLLLADTLLNDIPQNGLTVNVAVNGDANSTWIAASIPGRELLARPADAPLLLDVWLYVFDEQALAAAWNHVRIAVDLEKGRDFLSANPYTLRQEFRLGPGRYAVKALIRVADTDAIGFRRANFTVPRP